MIRTARPGRWRQIRLNTPRRRGGTGGKSSICGYFAINSSPEPPSSADYLLLDNTAFVHADFAGRQMQLVQKTVIVGDHDDGGASLKHVRQQFVVEFAAIFGILLGGPLVEQHDRPLFQETDDQSQPPA